MSYKRQELLVLRGRLGSLWVFFCGVRVAHLFSFLCCVFALCLVYPMLPVSLDCQFLIAPSVFCNAYLMKKSGTGVGLWPDISITGSTKRDSG